MIQGIGIDSVEIARFNSWKKYTKASLLKLFSQDELDYCFSVPTKTNERLAARFCAKEASYKACSTYLENRVTFMRWCKAVQVTKNSYCQPHILINWQFLQVPIPPIKAFLSITHTGTTATAWVVISAC